MIILLVGGACLLFLLLVGFFYRLLQVECDVSELAKALRQLNEMYKVHMIIEQSKLNKAVNEGWGPKTVEQTIDEGWTN